MGVATSESGSVTGPWVQERGTSLGTQRRPRDDLHRPVGRQASRVPLADTRLPNERVKLVNVELTPHRIRLLTGGGTANVGHCH